MKIEKLDVLNRGEVQEVAEYIADALEPDKMQDEDEYDGEAEETQRRSQNTQAAFGRLCDTLANKGLLTATDITFIANGNAWEEKARFVSDQESATKDEQI